MISFLRGKIIEFGKNYVILDVNGVGYRVHMSTKAINSISKRGHQINPVRSLARAKGASPKDLGEATSNGINLYTQMVFNQRDGVFELYGFLDNKNLATFGLLTSISGIGPKNALNILSSMEIEDLIAAVSKEDADYLRKVSGLGPKTARKLVLELKDKINKAELGKFAKFDSNQEGDAIDALISLGYLRIQASEALRSVPKSVKTLEERVKEALKFLSRKD